MRRLLTSLAALTFCAAPAPAQQISEEYVAGANQGFASDQGRTATWHLADHRKMASAISALKPQRAGVVDAYVVSAGFDSDPVFTREASEAAKVLARRFDAVGRSILIAAGEKSAPNGSPSNLATALAAVATKMNLKEDVLILFITTHGAPRIGLAYKDEGKAFGAVSPLHLSSLLNELGFQRRLIILSACYSGQFVAPLAYPGSVVVTAADDDRTSFGCNPSNDWTFFGDALINNALRLPQPLEKAIEQANTLIGKWETDKSLTASKPRHFIGFEAKAWLKALEGRMPPGTTPKTGRPAIEEK